MTTATAARTVIIGNSGSGKTWLASQLSAHHRLPVTHLDEIFWEPGGFDRPREASAVDALVAKTLECSSWLVEGVFGHLAARFLPTATTLIWLDTPIETCCARLLARGSERKRGTDAFESAEALRRLVGWAQNYDARQSMSSRAGHERLFASFDGQRYRMSSVEAVTAFLEAALPQLGPAPPNACPPALPPEDVASPIDLRRLEDAEQWAASAMVKRPQRLAFFKAFAEALRPAADGGKLRVLELGSGPGFLAEQLLTVLPIGRYVALDFSAAMHDLARARLGGMAALVDFVQRNLRDEAWFDDLGEFDAVVTIQAVHELRHNRHAVVLHQQVRRILAPGGCYLVCDHFLGNGGMSNDQLYMSVAAQRAALEQAGFPRVREVLSKGGLVLHQAC